MDTEIIVAGAGHGGIVAAYYLALEGYSVTVYEKNKRENLGHNQDDSIHLDGFEKSGIPVPEDYLVKRTPIAFFVPGTDIEPLVQADSGNTYNVEIDRNALYEHLIGLAENAGVKFIFECEVLAPIVLASRVIGIKTAKGDFLGSLIIDACGVNSPVRSQLPDFMRITKTPGKYDCLKAFRAYYKKNEGVPDQELRYQVSLYPGEEAGISWMVTHDDSIDILIGTFTQFGENQIENELNWYKSKNPGLSDKIIKGGEILEIPVRQTLSVMVADGYAAIGDSAFMTVPLKGSGIGYSMRAGKMLADAVIDDEDGLFNTSTLWKYQTEYYNEIGSSAGILAAIKDILPILELEDMEYAFGENVLSSEDMAMFGNEAGILKIIASLKLGALTDKAKKVIGHPHLRKLLMVITKNITRYLVVERLLPDEYNKEEVEKWQEASDEFFEKLKEQKIETADKSERKKDKKEKKRHGESNEQN